MRPTPTVVGASRRPHLAASAHGVVIWPGLLCTSLQRRLDLTVRFHPLDGVHSARAERFTVAQSSPEEKPQDLGKIPRIFNRMFNFKRKFEEATTCCKSRI